MLPAIVQVGNVFVRYYMALFQLGMFLSLLLCLATAAWVAHYTSADLRFFSPLSSSSPLKRQLYHHRNLSVIVGWRSLCPRCYPPPTGFAQLPLQAPSSGFCCCYHHVEKTPLLLIWLDYCLRCICICSLLRHLISVFFCYSLYKKSDSRILLFTGSNL